MAEGVRHHRDVLTDQVRAVGARGGLLITFDGEDYRLAFESLTPAEVRGCLKAGELYLRRIEQVTRDNRGQEPA